MWPIAIGPRSSSCIVRRLLASSVYNFSFLTSSWKTRQIKKKSNILYNCFFVTFCSLNISGKRKELYCGIYNIWPHYPGALWDVQICQKKKKEKKKRPNFKKLKKNLYRDYGTLSGPVWPYTSNRKNVFDLKKSTAGKDNLNAWLHVWCPWSHLPIQWNSRPLVQRFRPWVGPFGHILKS